jgi:hypothetical protein
MGKGFRTNQASPATVIAASPAVLKHFAMALSNGIVRDFHVEYPHAKTHNENDAISTTGCSRDATRGFLFAVSYCDR